MNIFDILANQRTVADTGYSPSLPSPEVLESSSPKGILSKLLAKGGLTGKRLSSAPRDVMPNREAMEQLLHSTPHNETYLIDLIRSRELEKSYPELFDLAVRSNPTMNAFGRYVPSWKGKTTGTIPARIEYNPNLLSDVDELLQALLHESKHGIDDIDNVLQAPGYLKRGNSSWNYWTSPGEVAARVAPRAETSKYIPESYYRAAETLNGYDKGLYGIPSFFMGVGNSVLGSEVNRRYQNTK
jgi:hypothetical protein